MAPKKEAVSELLAAATELDTFLRRFGDRTEALRVAPLDSQKHLKRASQLFSELGELEPEMAARVQTMASVLLQTRDTQQRWVDTIQSRATEYQARAAVLEELLLGYRSLGEGVGHLNAALRDIPPNAPPAERGARVNEALEGMRDLEAAARKLAERCTTEDFCDVGRQVDALRQQLVQAIKQLARLAPAAAAAAVSAEEAAVSAEEEDEEDLSPRRDDSASVPVN